MKKQLMLGGQAVVEGVLMKTASHYSVAVRLPSKKILVKRFRFISWTKHKGLGLPLIRGVVILAETLISGVKALTYSANKAAGEEEKEGGWELVGTLLFSLLFAIALFKFLPLWVAGWIQKTTAAGHLVFTLLDGLLKIIIFLIYLGVISRMKDVQRLFQYHGAEHMAVHCYEHKKSLTVKNVRGYPPEHPRCGTAFILLVFLISILVYLFVPDHLSLLEKLAWRVGLLPVIAGISYELLRWGGKYGMEKGMSWLTAPGLCLQKLTTHKPNAKQIEVAISALKSVLR
ncbi:MAG TPA: DUF1385 domain-containing protein [Candidatus Nanoarchaeia archaeon]|nr:DUF1385 domain-containing protein [Candidatus Nanoarchaeia archaeon]